jgi:hypothetical protein
LIGPVRGEQVFFSLQAALWALFCSGIWFLLFVKRFRFLAVYSVAASPAGGSLSLLLQRK